MSNKPNPALLAVSDFDGDAVREDLERTVAAARRYGRGLEMLLKDVSTVQHHPERLWEWSKIAVEVCKRGAD